MCIHIQYVNACTCNCFAIHCRQLGTHKEPQPHQGNNWPIHQHRRSIHLQVFSHHNLAYLSGHSEPATKHTNAEEKCHHVYCLDRQLQTTNEYVHKEFEMTLRSTQVT
jgi:hypothetical protein